MAYYQLASVYDRFMKEAPYSRWVDFTKAIIGNRPYLRIADLGCGTGEIAIRLAKEGYHVTGVDSSRDMLTVADQKAYDEKVDIQWVCQDIRELNGLENIDVCVSYCDVINYITEEKDLAVVFDRVYASLAREGLFMFDIHSLDHVSNHYINHTFADVMEDVSYIWFCREGAEPGEMFHDLTIFVKNGALYQRFDEIHHQRTYPVHFYERLLEKAGFQNISVYYDFSLTKEPAKTPERIFFVAEKIPE